MGSRRRRYDNGCFFRAEDGIRDIGVTGVQTCALPILMERADEPRIEPIIGAGETAGELHRRRSGNRRGRSRSEQEIGRASCRERVSIAVVARAMKKGI